MRFGAGACAAMTESDIWRSASMLHIHCGGEALCVAARRADVLLDKGDVSGCSTWIRIAEAIAELDRQCPETGEAVH